jgi:hypothetical protein
MSWRPASTARVQVRQHGVGGGTPRGPQRAQPRMADLTSCPHEDRSRGRRRPPRLSSTKGCGPGSWVGGGIVTRRPSGPRAWRRRRHGAGRRSARGIERTRGDGASFSMASGGMRGQAGLLWRRRGSVACPPPPGCAAPRPAPADALMRQQARTRRGREPSHDAALAWTGATRPRTTQAAVAVGAMRRRL